MRDRELLASYIPMVKFIAAFSGPRFEVVLHDLRDIEHSIIAIENGYISGRKLGDGLMDFAYQKFVEDTEDDFLVNQRSKPTKDHKILRLSGYRIRSNINHEIVGLLCVTEDITEFVQMRQMLNSYLHTEDYAYPDGDLNNELFALPLADTLEAAYRYAANEAGMPSNSQMSKADKMKIISILMEQHLFEVKGTVSFIAKKLMLSEPSIYRYLRELRNSMST